MKRRQGFTLVETMIAVAIIGLLAAISVPSISKVRSSSLQKVKTSNIRHLNDIVQQWSFDEMAGDNSLISASITNYMRGGIKSLSVGQEHVSLTNITSRTLSHTFTIDDLY